jgi:hypothetical protein
VTPAVEIQRLRKAIRDLHGVESSHLRSERVDDPGWKGVVEVFALKGHPKAGLAYAWSRPTDDGGRSYVAVLGVTPIGNARDAVRAASAAG